MKKRILDLKQYNTFLPAAEVVKCRKQHSLFCIVLCIAWNALTVYKSVFFFSSNLTYLRHLPVMPDTKIKALRRCVRFGERRDGFRRLNMVD